MTYRTQVRAVNLACPVKKLKIPSDLDRLPVLRAPTDDHRDAWGSVAADLATLVAPARQRIAEKRHRTSIE